MWQIVQKIAIYKIFGLPVAAIGGIITLLMFLTTGTVGYLIFSGKANISIKWHYRLALTSIVCALIHAIFALALFL